MQWVKKRFSDILKWEKEWFLSLEINDKLVWLYLLDNCDEAGLWNVNWRLCSMLTSVPLTECPKALKHQIVKTNHDKVVYIKDFMEFQYPDYLSKKSSMIIMCINRLISYDVIKQKDFDNAQDESGNESGRQSGGRVQDIDIDKDKVIRKKKDVSLKSITKEFLDDLQNKYMDVDIYLEFDKFKDYLTSNGKRYKDYQAGFRNWVKSPYVEKTDKIKNEMERKRREVENKKKEEDYDKACEDGEIGVPDDFKKMVGNLANKMGNNG